MTVHYLANGAKFASEWEHFRKGSVPLGWKLRNEGHEPWLRFHALPASKRYAETKREHNLILGRANWLAARILGENQPCWQVEQVVERQRHIGFYLEPDDNYRIYIHSKAVKWSRGSKDHLLTKVADDQSRCLWMNRSTGKIFAPYDGGFDLFPRDANEVNQLAKLRKNWLSNFPGGL